MPIIYFVHFSEWFSGYILDREWAFPSFYVNLSTYPFFIWHNIVMKQDNLKKVLHKVIISWRFEMESWITSFMGTDNGLYWCFSYDCFRKCFSPYPF